MKEPSIDRRREIALLLALAALWGASYSFVKLGVATIPPITLIAVRTLMAGGLLLAVLRWRGIALPRDAATWRRFAVQACLNSVLPFTLLAWGQQSVDAALAAILNSTTPVFVFLITALFTRHEPAGARQLFGVVMGLAGTALIVGLQAAQGLGREFGAQLAIVAATVCYAGAAIFGKRFDGLDPAVPAAGSLLCGAAILVPLSLLLERPWTLSPSASSIAALLALSVFSTALALTLYFRLVQTLGSVATASQAYLRVPIGVGIGVLFLGESLSSPAWAGLACVIVGVMALVARPSPRPN